MQNDKNAEKQDNSTIINHKKIFFCRKCYYFTCNRKDYKKHITRNKHLIKPDGKENNFCCPKCNHISFNPVDAYEHRKNCKKKVPKFVPLPRKKFAKKCNGRQPIMVRGQIISDKNDNFYPKNPQKFTNVCNKTYKYQSDCADTIKMSDVKN